MLKRLSLIRLQNFLKNAKALYFSNQGLLMCVYRVLFQIVHLLNRNNEISLLRAVSIRRDMNQILELPQEVLLLLNLYSLNPHADVYIVPHVWIFAFGFRE